MKVKNKNLFLFLVILFGSIQSRAQISIWEKNSLEKIKEGNTHVIVSSLDFPNADKFLAVFKKYWTITKGVDYIQAKDLQANLKVNDSYFSIETMAAVSGQSGASMFFIYLNLWVPKEKFLRKGKELKVADEISIAHIQLSSDFSTAIAGVGAARSGSNTPYYGFDFDGGDHIYNWNPGLLRNYLLQLSDKLLTNKKADLTDDFTDKSKLGVLKTQTLYCPDENLNKRRYFTKTDKAVDIKDIFEDYKFAYVEITDKELGEKILNDGEPFYYLLFLRNSTSKMIAVVNSKTGEIIYSRYHMSFAVGNLKSGDIKDLYKAINKN